MYRFLVIFWPENQIFDLSQIKLAFKYLNFRAKRTVLQLYIFGNFFGAKDQVFFRN